MKYSLRSRVGKVIPPDVTLGVVMRPRSTAAASSAAADASTTPPECSLTYDSFDGTGDLTTHEANTGGLWTAPEIDMDDGTTSNVGANPGLASAVLADGQFQFDITGPGLVLVLKPPTQPVQPNYFAEIEFRTDPETVYIEGIIALRCSPVVANLMSWIGIHWSFPGVGVTCVVTECDGAGGGSTTTLREFPLAGGYQNIIIRCAVENSTLTTSINGTAIDRRTFSNVLYDITGEITLAFNFIDDSVGDTLFEAPILRFCSGQLSEPT